VRGTIYPVYGIISVGMPKVNLETFELAAVAIVEAKQRGYSTSDAAVAGGVHRSTIYTWLALGRETGEEPYLTFADAFDSAVGVAQVQQWKAAAIEREREKRDGIRKRVLKPELPPIERAVPPPAKKKPRPPSLNFFLRNPNCVI
jgi:hypothetical protein